MMHWLRGHRRLRESLSAYLDGELSPAEVRAVESHLAECGVCRDELEGLRFAARALRSLPQVDPPRSFALGPEAVGAAGPARRPSSLLRLEVGLRLATAGLAVALAVVLVADLRGGGPSQSPQPEGLAQMASAPMETPRGKVAPEAERAGGVGGGGTVGGEYAVPTVAGTPTAPPPASPGPEITGAPADALAPAPGETAEPLAMAPPQSVEEAPAVEQQQGAAGSSGDGLRAAEVALAAALAVSAGATAGLALRRRRVP